MLLAPPCFGVRQTSLSGGMTCQRGLHACYLEIRLAKYSLHRTLTVLFLSVYIKT